MPFDVIRPPGRAACRPAAAALALILVLFAAGCGDDDRDDSGGSGAPPESMSEPVNTLSLARFAVETMAWNLDHDRAFDRSWSYDPSEQAWVKVDSGLQSINVGGLHGRTYQIVTDYRIGLTLYLTRNSLPVQDLRQADRARLKLAVERRRYASDAAVTIENSYDLELEAGGYFGLADGRPDTVTVEGNLGGVTDPTIDSSPVTYRYGGGFRLGFDFPGQYDRCAAQRLTADIIVMDETRGELDHYSGTIEAAAGDPEFQGYFESRKGPGRVGIHSGRTCP